MNKEAELKKLQKEVVKISIIDMPAYILITLSIYAKFGSNGQPFLSILKNDVVVLAMFVVGISIAAWSAVRLIAIAKQRKALEQQ